MLYKKQVISDIVNNFHFGNIIYYTSALISKIHTRMEIHLPHIRYSKSKFWAQKYIWFSGFSKKVKYNHQKN